MKQHFIKPECIERFGLIVMCPMIEGCRPVVSEDRGHTSNIDGPEALAISICDVSYKLMNLKIILLLIHCVVDMRTSQARLIYLAMYERCCIVRVMVSENR